MLGVTRRYDAGAPGPRPRRSAVGWLASRAQSRGECPGSSVTLRLGLLGLLACVGGGARVEVPGWRSYCAWRFGRGEGRAVGGAARREDEAGVVRVLFSFGGRESRGGGGGIDIAGDAVGPSTGGAGGFIAAVLRATAAAEAGGSITVEGDSEKEGMDPLAGAMEAEAFGVVCGDGEDGGEGAIVTTGMSASTGLLIVAFTSDERGDAISGIRLRPVSALVFASALLTGASWRTRDMALASPRPAALFVVVVEEGERVDVDGGCWIWGDRRHRAIRVSTRGGLRIAMYTTEAKMSDQPSRAIPWVGSRRWDPPCYMEESRV